jgi:hypothetical protein
MTLWNYTTLTDSASVGGGVLARASGKAIRADLTGGHIRAKPQAARVIGVVDPYNSPSLRRFRRAIRFGDRGSWLACVDDEVEDAERGHRLDEPFQSQLTC